MQIKEKIIGDVAVLRCKGSLMGEPYTTKLREKIHSLVNDEIRRVVIDMGGVKWINSAGLGSLIAGLTTLRNAGGDLRLAHVTDKVESLFMITQLIKVFKSYDSVDRAIASFKK